MVLVLTPGSCWLPSAVTEGRRLWGIAAQLYLLRSGSDWGIGDFGDLRHLVELAADRGADVIGLNPLHAMFPDDPEHASPYSPASRLLLNILNIDVTAVPELLDCPETRELIASETFGQDVQACRSKHLVDYAGVAAIKLSVLKRLFDACRGSADPARWRAFEAFRRERGDVWSGTACFWRCANTSPIKIFPAPTGMPGQRNTATRPRPPSLRFAEENQHRLDLIAWRQWIADEQLATAAATARERGMAAGATPIAAPERELTTDVDAVLARVTERTRVVFIANPNNPTGTYLGAQEIARLHAGLPASVLLAIDAAYAEFVNRNDYEPGIALVNRAENVVMLRTFSKIYALAGLRLGWAYCPPAIADVLNRVRSPFNVSAAAQAAGVAAVEDVEALNRARAHNDRWLPWFSERLAALALPLTPSVANFVLARFPDDPPKNADAAFAFLQSRGILTRKMGAYGLPQHLRITVGTGPEMETVAAALAEFMAAR